MRPGFWEQPVLVMLLSYASQMLSQWLTFFQDEATITIS